MPLTEGMKLADVILRAESDKKLVPYREGAAESLILRFAAENTKDDGAIREVRKEIALAMLDLMKSKDDGSVVVIEKVLKAWYGTMLTQTGFKADGKPAARAKAYTEMKKKLKAN
jgi:hypothetical protein